MDATTVAIDLAKDVFQVAVANRAGRVVDRQRLTPAIRAIRRHTRGSDGCDHGVVRYVPLLGTSDAGARPAGAAPARAVRPTLRPAKQDGPCGYRRAPRGCAVRRDSAGAGEDGRAANAASD